MKTNSQNAKKKTTVKENTTNNANAKGKETSIDNDNKIRTNIEENNNGDVNDNNNGAINDNNEHNGEGGLEEYLKRQQDQTKSSALLLTEYKPEFQHNTNTVNNNKDELTPITENLLENTNPFLLNSKPTQPKPSPSPPSISNIISSSDMPLFIQEQQSPKQIESTIEDPPFDNKSLPREPSLQLTEVSPDPK